VILKYFYSNNVSDINSFKFADSDFKNFKNYLKQSNFSFETKTEKALSSALEIAKDEEFANSIQSDYNNLIDNLNRYKNEVIDDQKTQLSSLLTDEIVKRYVYREGLYEYYTKYNPEIKKAVEILNNPTKYRSYLK